MCTESSPQAERGMTEIGGRWLWSGGAELIFGSLPDADLSVRRQEGSRSAGSRRQISSDGSARYSGRIS